MPRGRRDDPWTREAEAAVREYRRRSRLRGPAYAAVTPGDRKGKADEALLARREQARRDVREFITRQWGAEALAPE